MNSAFWPSVRLAAYWSMFCAVMVNKGFSSAYGSGYGVPAPPNFSPGGRPRHLPLQAGMLPSALPAFSAPIGVRSWPRRAASSLLTLACRARLLPSRATARVVRNHVWVILDMLCSSIRGFRTGT
ncbi:hypothetical protein D9M73_242500 [compost metagenome]